jgi:hypothetical protein
MLGRPRLEPGTYGSISVRVRESGSYFAEARVRDWDGRVRKVAASHADEDEAILALKKRIARQLQITDPEAEITGQTPFPALTRNWLVDLKLDSQLSDGTKEVYENELRTLVMPAFEQCTVSDLTAVRIERFLKVQRAKSYTKAKHSKVLLSLLIRYAMLHGALGTTRFWRPRRFVARKCAAKHSRSRRSMPSGGPQVFGAMALAIRGPSRDGSWGTLSKSCSGERLGSERLSH